MSSSRPMVDASPTATIKLPAGMILRCLPPELLTSDVAQFEASGAAATEIPLPLNAILSQLPSGKVELPIADIVSKFPPGFLKSGEEIASQPGGMAGLPLMDVVMRIPPDLLSVRPDQKGVDAGATHMADPFTEGSLRKSTESSPQPRIVEESQVVPTEEFVPKSAPVAFSAAPSFVPPPRPITSGLPLLSQTASLSGRPTAPQVTEPVPTRGAPAPKTDVPPMPLRPAQQPSASQVLGVPRPAGPPPASAPVTGNLLATSFPHPVAAPSTPSLPPPVAEPSSPPSAPAVPPASFTPRAPEVSSMTPTIPMVRPVAIESPAASADSTPTAEPATTPAAPAANVEELQRLAALAMAEIDAKAVEAPSTPAEAPAVVESEPPAPIAPASLTSAPLPNPSVPPRPAQVEPGLSATSRFGFASGPARELAETTAVVPAPTPSALTQTGPNPVTLAREVPAPLSSARSITTRVPSAPAKPEEEGVAASGATAVNLNNCAADDLLAIPGINRELAGAIVRHRDKIGEFHRLEELLDVPGMSRTAYASLTGEVPPTGLHPSINELLGFPADRNLSLKDVTDRIACWPDVTGCLLSQRNGLALVGTAPDFLDRQAIVAFAPRIFEDLNKSFAEITGRQTEEIVIPTTGTSFHLMRDRDMYLIILARVPQMPDRHLKIARMVLAGLSVRPS